MATLFWICWGIDCLLLLICLFETFAVSSNRSLLVQAIVLAILLAGGWLLKNTHPTIALLLMGLPALLLVLFVVYFFVSALFRDKWI